MRAVPTEHGKGGGWRRSERAVATCKMNRSAHAVRNKFCIILSSARPIYATTTAPCTSIYAQFLDSVAMCARCSNVIVFAYTCMIQCTSCNCSEMVHLTQTEAISTIEKAAKLKSIAVATANERDTPRWKDRAREITYYYSPVDVIFGFLLTLGGHSIQLELNNYFCHRRLLSPIVFSCVALF